MLWSVVARVALSICILFMSLTAMADNARSWWKTRDQQGVELLQSGDAETASEVFRDSQWRGVSLYRNGNFAAAQKAFSESGDADSLYNEGTAAARAGDYQTAVEKLEQVTEADPSHVDAAHNLDIVRQLLDAQQDDSQQEQDDSGENDSEDQAGNESQSDQQEGDQQGEQQQNESSQQSDSESGDQQSNDAGGDLSADEEDAKAAEENQNQSAQTSSEQEQSESQEPETGEEDSADQSESAANFAQTEPISESEQATEQWMRRIPDDPSQLLRNKIKLNHMIQHENVRDLAEPW